MGTVIAELVAFALIVYVLYRYVWPPVRKLMEDRQELVAQQEAEAQDAEKTRVEAQRKHDSAVSEAEQEASRIRDDARADATRIREEIEELTEQDVARITRRGEEQLVAERDAAVRKLRAETGSLSMDLARRIIAEAMTGESEKRASVDGFLDDLDRLDGSGSGSGPRQPAQAGGGMS